MSGDDGVRVIPMPYADLRAFLDLCAAREALMTVEREVDPVFEVTAYMPMTENHWMIEPAIHAAVHRVVHPLTPEIAAIDATPGGATRHHVVVAVRKRHGALRAFLRRRGGRR